MELLGLAGWVVAFQLLNAGLGRLLPAPAPADPWEWRNIWTSLVHSLLSGVGALLWLFAHPRMAEDLLGAPSAAAHRLVGFSVGYFLYDSIDMMCNQKLSQCWELLLHHTVVIISLGIAFLFHHFASFAMVGLLVEVNSVFLHLRSILSMAGLSHSPYYRLTSWVNLGTHMVFRISTLTWMTCWLVVNQENIPLFPYVVSTLGLAIMIPMNIILFYRLLHDECLSSSQHDKKQ